MYIGNCDLANWFQEQDRATDTIKTKMIIIKTMNKKKEKKKPVFFSVKVSLYIIFERTLFFWLYALPQSQQTKQCIYFSPSGFFFFLCWLFLLTLKIYQAKKNQPSLDFPNLFKDFIKLEDCNS